MMSQHRNQGRTLTAANAIPEQRILDAVYDLLVSRGMRKTTMADIARQAGVSRATLYRRWHGVNEVVAALMTREWSRFGTALSLSAGGNLREVLVDQCVHVAREARRHPLLRAIVEIDPEVLLPYVLKRRGTNTEGYLSTLEKTISAGIAEGSIRPGDAAVRAQAVLLTGMSFVLTGPVFARDDADLAALDEELRTLLDRYLAP